MSKRRPKSQTLEYERQRQQRTRAFGIGLVVVVGVALLAALALRARPETSAPLAQSVGAYLEWPIVIADSFDAQGYGWQYGNLTNDIADANLSLRGGQYHWELAPRNSVLWWSLADPSQSIADVYVAVEARQITGTTRSDYGLVFRWSNEDYYYYQISPAAQQVALNLYSGGQWLPLMNWTDAPAPIETDSLNRLAVAAEGSRFTLYLNGQVAGSVTDDHLPEGSAGVGVQIYFDDPGGDDTGAYEFDNFEWRAPP
jgi:hypothetical protein